MHHENFSFQELWKVAKTTNWKTEVERALALIKGDMKVRESVAHEHAATYRGILFILVPQLLGLIISIIEMRSWVGYMHGSYLISIINPFLFLYGVELVATKFFHAKPNFLPFFRVVSYVYALSILIPIVALLSMISWSIAGLMGLVMLGIGIWGLIVTYGLLKSHYQLSNSRAILTLIITIILVAIVSGLLQNLLFPSPLEELSRYDWGRF